MSRAMGMIRSLVTVMMAITMVAAATASAFVAPTLVPERSSSSFCGQPLCLSDNNKNEWTSDFDDFISENDNDDFSFSLPLPDLKMDKDDDDDDKQQEGSFEMQKSLEAALLQRQKYDDSSAIRQRQFSLGKDLVLSGFAGSMGFDQVTDWEYYAQDEDTGERKVVDPPPLDPSKPKRTRERVGSVIRIFRGEFTGALAGTIRSQGLDARVLVKEFAGEMALDLARAELASVAKMQSALLQSVDTSDWTKAASARSSVMARQDNAHLAVLLTKLQKEGQCLGILGEVNMAELEEDEEFDKNEWYRALSVPPPKPNSIWIVYEYAGLSTAQQYCQPGLVRRASLPPKRGIFGNLVEPPSLPAWNERARYVVQGILKGALEAVAALHQEGICHRSIGRTSILLSTTAMDKTEAASPYATMVSMLRIKLADFGFSGLLEEAYMDEDFCRRARGFGLTLKQDASSKEATNFAIAEDLHALGFVFIGLLLTSLAEPPSASYNLPSTDDDTLQRQLKDIFGNDFIEFREYVSAEEEVWSNVVKLLDQDDGDGWKVLRTLCLARERAADPNQEMITAQQILESPFFTN